MMAVNAETSKLKPSKCVGESTVTLMKMKGTTHVNPRDRVNVQVEPGEETHAERNGRLTSVFL